MMLLIRSVLGVILGKIYVDCAITVVRIAQRYRFSFILVANTNFRVGLISVYLADASPIQPTQRLTC